MHILIVLSTLASLAMVGYGTLLVRRAQAYDLLIQMRLKECQRPSRSRDDLRV